MAKKLSDRRVQELKFPSSAYASQDRIKSQVNEMMSKRLHGSNTSSLEQKFNFLQQGTERIAFLRAHSAMLEQVLNQPELAGAEAFIQAVCQSPLECHQGKFLFGGSPHELCELANELNTLFSELVMSSVFNRHQHLAIELSGALDALTEEPDDLTASKAVLDILAVMVSRLIK